MKEMQGVNIQQVITNGFDRHPWCVWCVCDRRHGGRPSARQGYSDLHPWDCEGRAEPGQPCEGSYSPGGGEHQARRLAAGHHSNPHDPRLNPPTLMTPEIKPTK